MGGLADLRAEKQLVDTAIRQILESNTQSYTVAGDMHYSPRLESLFAERDRLRQLIDAHRLGSAISRRVRVVQ